MASTCVPVLTRSRPELADALAAAPGPRAVVMTMGALHQGHLDLVAEAARRVGAHGTVVVTIFVNPLQFAAGEDLDAYPRTLRADVQALGDALTGPDGALVVGRLVVFAPTPEVMYPGGQPAVRIDPGPVATVLEGRTRPTHFAGVCQVVLALLHLTAPRWALFGRKDAQQLAIVRAMVRDLAVPVEVVPVDIRREADGLAMSSRNVYLSGTQRQQALALSRALAAGSRAAAGGADGAGVRQAALAVLGGADGVEVDYVALVDPDSFVDLADAGLGLPAAPQVAPAELGAGTGQTGDEPGAGAGPETGTGPQAGDDPGREVSAGAGRTALDGGLRQDDRGRGQTGVGPEAGDDPGREVSAGAGRTALLALAARVGSTRLIDNALVVLH